MEKESTQDPLKGEWDAELYHQHSDLQAKWHREFFLDRYPFRGDEAILDVGCGDGKLTATVSKYVPQGRVLGVDPSPVMLGFAQNHYTKKDYPNLDYASFGALDLPFPETYDVITSFSALHWCPHHDRVLSGIAKTLKPGGYAYLLFNNVRDVPVLEAAAELIRQDPWAPYFKDFILPMYTYEHEVYESFFRAAGLESLEHEKCFVDESMPSKEALVSWLEAVMPQLEYLPVSMQKSWVQSVVERYLLDFPEDTQGKLLFRDCQRRMLLQKKK